MGATEEVTGWVIRAAQGAEVKAGVVGAAHGIDGKTEGVVAVCGVGEVIKVIECAVIPPKGAIGPLASTARVDRPPQGTV
jgi:hypothetical protein